ncbi:hypothetical protein [Streptomyces sp. MBT27]|uniref:hypothetical protein n=1 Tax=Streptomyces sp. MBT27 TaxID=1488356 RepID=UPI0014246DC0|nr:hypothetical protein [Streptomyces sp. MBT27]
MSTTAAPATSRTNIKLATLAVLTTALGGVAVPAHATSIIGFGNSAHDNSCANQTTPQTQARGATTQTSGILTALTAALPASGPVNQCGNLGLPVEDSAVSGGVPAATTGVGTSGTAAATAATSAVANRGGSAVAAAAAAAAAR